MSFLLRGGKSYLLKHNFHYNEGVSTDEKLNKRNTYVEIIRKSAMYLIYNYGGATYRICKSQIQAYYT